MATHTPPPDEAHIMAVTKAVTAELNELKTALQGIDLQSLPPGVSLGQVRGLTAATYVSVYNAAEALCDQGRFAEALPLTTYLVAHEPRHPPFAFIAASCLQRLGDFASAAELFVLSVNDGANDALAAFRLGECLEALQHRKGAGDAFDAALDLSRNNADLWQLQDWAMSRSQALKSNQENRHAR